MKTNAPLMPDLVKLRVVTGGELVSCAEFKDEVLFVPDDEHSLEDDTVILFNIETGQSRELSLDATVIWHNDSKITVSSKKQSTSASNIVYSPERYSLTQGQLQDIIRGILDDHGKIELIKWYRAYTNCSLNNAKSIVGTIITDHANGHLDSWI